MIAGFKTARCTRYTSAESDSAVLCLGALEFLNFPMRMGWKVLLQATGSDSGCTTQASPDGMPLTGAFAVCDKPERTVVSSIARHVVHTRAQPQL